MIRGIVSQVIEGMIKRFTAAGRSNETIANREYFQHYGFTSRPLSGAEAIIINEGNHIIMIASDDRRYRLALEEGEAAIYDDLEQKVHLKRTGVEISSPLKITAMAPEIILQAETKITFDTPVIEASGTFGATGSISSQALVSDSVRSMAADRTIYDGHTHNDPQGGVVAAPNQQE